MFFNVLLISSLSTVLGSAVSVLRKVCSDVHIHSVAEAYTSVAETYSRKHCDVLSASL